MAGVCYTFRQKKESILPQFMEVFFLRVLNPEQSTWEDSAAALMFWKKFFMFSCRVRPFLSPNVIKIYTFLYIFRSYQNLEFLNNFLVKFPATNLFFFSLFLESHFLTIHHNTFLLKSWVAAKRTGVCLNFLAQCHLVFWYLLGFHFYHLLSLEFKTLRSISLLIPESTLLALMDVRLYLFSSFLNTIPSSTSMPACWCPEILEDISNF